MKRPATISLPFANPVVLGIALIACSGLTFILWPTPRHREHQLVRHPTIPATPTTTPAANTTQAAPPAPAPVELELFVMSQCPDARSCEQLLEPLAQAFAPDVLRVRVTHIMKAPADAGGKLQCMHGDVECAGNMQQQCVQAHTPPAKNYHWLYKYLLCTWADGGVHVGTPDQLPTCLSKVGVPPEVARSMEQCIAGGKGIELAKASAERVAQLAVKRSCTVYLDGKKRCVRDGGAWYSGDSCPGGSAPADFVRSLCDAYAAKQGAGAAPPAACKQGTVQAPGAAGGGSGSNSSSSSAGASG